MPAQNTATRTPTRRAPAHPDVRIASLFQNRRNQAVRIPREFEFTGVKTVEIERKGESGKYNLESMGKGVYINGNLYEAKVRCAIDYIVAKEVELRGGLKQGESAVSIEKELFPTKNESPTPRMMRMIYSVITSENFMLADTTGLFFLVG